MIWPSRMRDDAVGQLGQRALVRDQHHRHAALAIERAHGGHDVERGLGVEIAGRLIGQHDRRIVHQRARDGYALLLAAGELVGLVASPVARPSMLSMSRTRSVLPLICAA
jgi:hypothetical protein